MSRSIKALTEFAIRDLHARELMRLGWYRQLKDGSRILLLREKKAQHEAFLRELLRNRSLSPFWYSRIYYYLGHLLGYFAAMLPAKLNAQLQRTLEHWILLRYEKYFSILQLKHNLRSMIEAIQLSKLSHNEPGLDVLHLFENYIQQQQQLLSHQNQLPS